MGRATHSRRHGLKRSDRHIGPRVKVSLHKGGRRGGAHAARETRGMTTVSAARTALFIGGRWVGGAGVHVVEDPATGAVIAEVATATPDHARAAVDAAAMALPAWATTAPRARGEVLRRAYESMIEHAEQLGDLIVAENGKPHSEALGEVRYAADYLRWFSEEAVRMEGHVLVAPAGGYRHLVQRHPIGVCMLVTPWNFPAAMAARKIAPALAAGCTVVLKPSPETPLTALAIADLLDDAGVPAGVVNVIPTDDAPSVVGAAMAERAVRKLSFTGSTAVGRRLLALAADRVVACSMELGGNAPFLVLADLDDAGLDAAVDAAVIAKMRNSAQACTSANRFYVEAPIAEAFTERFVARLGAMRMGPGADPSSDIGPLITEQARRRVHQTVLDAVRDGASVVVGGEMPDGRGNFYPPTVLTGVAPDADVLKAEIFGPVAPIVVVPADDDAGLLALANGTEAGLVAYAYGSDLGRLLRLSEGLDAGMVGLNRGLISDAAAPFGGTKQSGLGREGSSEGINEYTEQRYVAVSW